MTSTNNPTVTSHVGQPRLRILTNGKEIPGALDASWHQTSHYAPDTFSATFALNADPRYTAAWWDNRTTPLVIDIQAGFRQPNGAMQWSSLGVGQVDDHEINLVSGTIVLTGRDLSALLVDAETAETFQNQTSSQVVQTLATRAGLSSDVTNTTTLVSRYWELDHTVTKHHQHSQTVSDWDLLVKLARNEGFDLFVVGTKLYFWPPPSLTGKPYVVKYDPATATAFTPAANVIEPHFTRRFALAKGVTVNVKSFHSKAGKAVVATVTRGPGVTGSNVGGSIATQTAKAKTYTFVRPNLTQAQAQTLAQSLLDDITRHERTVSFHGPADLILGTRSVVRVEGTGTGFDQTYYVEHVTRTISFDGGFVMDAQAKNHSPQVADATVD